MGDVGVWARWASVGIFVLASVAGAADSTSAREAKEEKYAVLIGVSYYEDKAIPSLPFVENDVALIAETLTEQDFIVYPFCEPSAVDLTNPKIQKPTPPTKANILRAFTDAKNGPLKKILGRKNATLLVYFSGHGHATSETSEKTLLVARDTSLKNAANDAVNAQALREAISESRCARRLLVIDACRAGGTRSASTNAKERAAYAEIFQNSFREGGVDGVPTFASCSFKGASYSLAPYVKRFDESQKKRDVSAFTYWFNEALKGRADGVVDGTEDGRVGSDEIFEYVAQNLDWMRSVGRGWQTPTIVASQDEKPFDVCAVPKRGYLETIDDLAEEIVTKAKILGKKEVYVEQFSEAFASAALRNDEEEVAALRSFAASATEQLRASVLEKWKALEKGSTTRLDGVASDRRFVVKAVVEARRDAERNVEYAITCDARSAGTGNAARNFASVKACVSRKDAPEGAAKSVSEVEGTLDLPMNVRVEARSENESVWRTRPIREIAGERWVELNPGETYRVWFEPNGGAPSDAEKVVARLLVDGRNSLAQYEPRVDAPSDFAWQIEEETQDGETEGGETSVDETTQDEETQGKRKVVAPVVPLDAANYWVLNPNASAVVDGFHDQFAQTSAVFSVVKADVAVDASDEDERGLIVVAFYKATKTRGPLDVMTEPGPRQRVSTIVVKGVAPGASLGLLRLRYASADYLARLGESETTPTPAVGEE